MSFYDLALSRRSIRKYTAAPIPHGDVEKMLSAAIAAPSACNSQNWHFVALESREAIDGLAQAVSRGITRKMGELGLDEEPFLSSRIRSNTFFRDAPLVIAVYMEPMTYYESRVTKALSERGVDYDALVQQFGQPDLLGVGAAIENLLLCAYDLGYGGCWMNDPVLVAREIDEYLGQSAPRRLVSLVPIGVPAYQPRAKQLRPDVIEYR